MITTLQDQDGKSDHKAFQTWRRLNPDAAFLTFETKHKVNLHGSRCWHLGTTSWTVRQAGQSLTKKRKVFGASESDLISWARANGLEVNSCRHCLRDALISDVASSGPISEALDYEAIEGLAKEVLVLSRGRNAKLRKVALAKANGTCEVCETVFSGMLSGKGTCVLQVHHRKQLALSDMPRITTLEDLAVVCANCHALIHLDKSKALSTERLRVLLAGDLRNRARK